jgi:hypothetical protein
MPHEDLDVANIRAAFDERRSKAVAQNVRRDAPERITFLGMNDLNKKIVPGHIGHWMDIRYERNDSSFVKPGQSPAKIFKVLVAKEKEPGF